jgi:hypothetical protein
MSESSSSSSSNKYIEILKDVLGSSSIHGSSNIVKNQSIVVKLFWTVCLVVSSGFFMYLLIQTVLDFLNFDVVTQIKVEKKITTDFPTVMICNQNLFTTNYSKQTVMNILNVSETQLSARLDLPFDNQTDTYNTQSQNFYARYSTSYLVKIAVKTMNDSQRRLFGSELDKILVACNFATQMCNKTEFEYFYNFNYGNCYKFNSGKDMHGNSIDIKTLSNPGKDFGLKMILFAGNSALDPFSRFDGFNVFVGDKDYEFSTGTYLN